MKKRRRVKQQKEIQPPQPPPPDFIDRLKSSKPGKIIALLASVIAFVGVLYAVKDGCKTVDEKHDEATYKRGELSLPINPVNPSSFDIPINPIFSETIPDTAIEVRGILLSNISPNNPTVSVSVGYKSNVFQLSQLYNGVDIGKMFFNKCTPEIYLIARKNRLYISTQFKDIQDGLSIGIIEFNRWRILRAKSLFVENSDHELEVKDLANNIVFSMKYYPDDNGVIISGYFMRAMNVQIVESPLQLEIGDDFTGVSYMGDTCIDIIEGTNWKQKALQKIEKIQPARNLFKQ